MTPTEKIRDVLDRTVADCERSLADAKRSGVDALECRAEGELKIARAARTQAQGVLTALADRNIDADEILCGIMEIVLRFPAEGVLGNSWSVLCAGKKAFANAVAEYDGSNEP